MSPKSQTQSSLNRPRRASGKPGRFDPSEPLHMTTRKAARNGRTNSTPSINGSVEDDESRRGSFDDIRPTTSQSLGSQTSAKPRRRISGSSTNGASDVNMSFETTSSLEKIPDRPRDDPASPKQPASPSRKRKRSTPTPPETPTGAGNMETYAENDPDPLDNTDMVEVVPRDLLDDRGIDSGDSDSEEAFAGSYLDVAQSTELTPAATPAGSEAVSPISEVSNTGVPFPTKGTDVSLVDPGQHIEPEGQEDGDDAGELGDAEEMDEVENADDADDQDGVVGKSQRRLPLGGRKRADHPLTDIEAVMRRQAQLKSAYRSIARALKPVLAEISLKTVEELEANPTMHEQMPEYRGNDEEDGIQAMLDQAFARRKAQLDAQRKWNHLQLQKTFEGERQVRDSRCRLQIEDLRESQLDALEHDLLVIARRAQLDDGSTAYETDDEDGQVIPRPHRTGYRFVRSGTLDPKYDSRSRVALESERALRDLQLRFEMHKMLREVHGSDESTPRPGFTVMDDAPRRAAEDKRESIRNTQILADAAAEAERLDNYKPIPNEEAHGLQMLGDLASRPSIRAAALPRRRDEDVFGPLLHPVMPPPPPMRAPFTPGHGSQEMPPQFPTHQEHPHLPGPPGPPPHQEIGVGMQQEHPFLSPRAKANHTSLFSPVANPGFGVDQSPSRRSISQLPTPNMAHVGQSPVRLEHSGRAPSDVPTPTRESSSREQYQRPLTMERETRQSPDRVLHNFSSGPLKIERVKPNEEERPHTRHQHDAPGDKSPSRQPMHAEPHWEPPSSPGAADTPDDSMDFSSASQAQEQSNDNVAADGRSRASSIVSQSTATEASPDEAAPGEPAAPKKGKRGGHKTLHYHLKTNRTDRNGLTRKLYKSGSKRQSYASAKDNGPSVLRFRLNSETPATTQTQPPHWTPATAPAYPMPMHDFYGPPPAWGGYYSPHMHPHPPPGYYGYQPPPPPEYGYWYHRNSVPPPGTAHPWPAPPPPQSPLYAVPPEGPPRPEHWGPPPQYVHPQQGPHTPVTPLPPPGPIPFGHEAGGRPLAPSLAPAPASGPSLAPNIDPRLNAGGPPNHPPAFAQQQRHNEGSRRRAQSDTQHTKFKQYQPRQG